MKAMRKSSLAREIMVVIVIKVVSLLALWLAFFREPVSHDLDNAGVSRAIVGEPATPGTRDNHP